MQLVFHTTVSPQEYYRLGKDFPFPEPSSCPSPQCLVEIPPKKHGFYTRNVHDGNFSARIFIRRYYCPFCHTTISYLPSFCLPYFQFTLDLIFTSLQLILMSNLSLRPCLKFLKESYQHLFWEISHLQFYLRRFLANLRFIKLVLRQLEPQIELPEEGTNKREGAQKVLHLLATRFSPMQFFSFRFHQACGYSFMAPSHSILA